MSGNKIIIWYLLMFGMLLSSLLSNCCVYKNPIESLNTLKKEVIHIPNRPYSLLKMDSIDGNLYSVYPNVKKSDLEKNFIKEAAYVGYRQRMTIRKYILFEKDSIGIYILHHYRCGEDTPDYYVEFKYPNPYRSRSLNLLPPSEELKARELKSATYNINLFAKYGYIPTDVERTLFNKIFIDIMDYNTKHAGTYF